MEVQAISVKDLFRISLFIQQHLKLTCGYAIYKTTVRNNR